MTNISKMTLLISLSQLSLQNISISVRKFNEMMDMLYDAGYRFNFGYIDFVKEISKNYPDYIDCPNGETSFIIKNNDEFKIAIKPYFKIVNLIDKEIIEKITKIFAYKRKFM